MSWQAASFALVGLALVAGFVWYERTRPSSRVLAVVATLAALAALGRVAFAPLPDVKPTTAIVLISGYALGGAPGFAIGASAALTSNMFYGQGPWTPWQMLGWGAAGVIGALLARIGGRRLGRWPLALACGGAAIVFNLLADLSIWVTYAGDLTARRFLLIESASLWFNVVHVIASIGFFLAFGPALIRVLERYRARLDVRWRRPPAGVVPLAIAAAVAATALLAGLPPTARAGAAARSSAARGGFAPELRYLRGAQRSDGGFGEAAGASSTQLFSAWAALGIAAAGDDPAAFTRSGHSVIGYIEANLAQVHDPGDLERTILGLAAGGASVRHAGGRDLVAELDRAQQRDGSFSEQANLTAFAILALRAAGTPSSALAVRRARAWLAAQQDGDGGYSFAGRGGGADVDDTAAAIEALAASGGGPMLARGAGFIAARQNRDGGFPLSPGGASNAQSTAWAIQGLLAAGRNPAALHRRGSRDPLTYLRSLVAPDGSVRYSRTSSQTPVWVTAQALTALARRPLPIRAAHRANRAVAAAAPAGGPRPSPAATARHAHRHRSSAQTPRAATSTAGPAAGRRLRRLAREAGAFVGLLAAIGAPPPVGIG